MAVQDPIESTLLHYARLRLQTLARELPESGEAADYYIRLVSAFQIAGARISPTNIPVSTEALQAKIASGIALLAGEALEIPPGVCREVFRDMCLPVSQPVLETPAGIGFAPPDTVKSLSLSARSILANVIAGDLDPSPLIAALASGDIAPVEAEAARLGLDFRLLNILAQNTLKAFLRVWRSDFEKQVELDEWQRSFCPICGSPPGLAELQGVENTRHLRCLRCGADWSYPHLRCAFCENDDYHSLGILFVDSQNEHHREPRKYYAHTCERCRQYIKTIVTFEPTPVDLLIVEDLATLQLDGLAAERGYRMMG